MIFSPKSFRVDHGQYGECIVLTGKWDDGVAEYARKNSIRELIVNSEVGGTIKDLSFLSRFPDLIGFTILDFNIGDILPIHQLHKLKFLEISTYCSTPIDFSQFPELESCTFYWRSKSQSLFQCKTIKKLFIHGYPFPDAVKLAELENLEDLSIVSSSIVNIESLGLLKRLEHLGLYVLGKLSSLAGLERCVHLKELAIGTCRQISSIWEVGNLIHLESLQLDNCGDIDSIKPLKKLARLKKLSFVESTNILDGDLSPILKLGLQYGHNLSFQNRRHYSHKREDFA